MSLGQNARFERSMGFQESLYLSAVPAGAVAKVGQSLVEADMSVAGVYYCDLSLEGLTSAIEVFLKATFGSGSCTSDAYSTYRDGTTKKTAFGGVGAMATTVLQSLTFTPKGEQMARIKLTIVGTAVDFTIGEANGL